MARVQRTLHMKDDTDFVGLHVRRGDKIKEVMLPPLKKYANAVTLMASNQTTVFIATDDGSVLSPLQNMLSPRPVVFMPAAMRRQGHIQGNMNRLFLKTNYERVIVLLAEIEMLRKATVFVSTFSSNLARLVHVLRWQDVNNSVSLDDRWEPGVAWRTFGMNYCDAPGANEVFCANM